jgi:hypothetical protein
MWQIFTLDLCKCKKINIYTLQQDKCKCKKFGRVSVNKYIYIYTLLQQDKCKCKKFGHVSVNDLHLH